MWCTFKYFSINILVKSEIVSPLVTSMLMWPFTGPSFSVPGCCHSFLLFKEMEMELPDSINSLSESWSITRCLILHRYLKYLLCFFITPEFIRAICWSRELLSQKPACPGTYCYCCVRRKICNKSLKISNTFIFSISVTFFPPAHWKIAGTFLLHFFDKPF